MKKTWKRVDFVGFSLGENIQYYRNLAGLTQQELAEKVGVSTHFISQIERNQDSPALDNFVKISKALSIPADYLLVEMDRSFRESSVAFLMEKLKLIEHEDLVQLLSLLRKINEHSETQEELKKLKFDSIDLKE